MKNVSQLIEHLARTPKGRNFFTIKQAIIHIYLCLHFIIITTHLIKIFN